MTRPKPLIRHFLATLALAVLATGAAHAQGSLPTGCGLQLEIKRVAAGQGPVMVAVYESEAQFMKEMALAVAAQAKGETLSLPLCNLSGEEVAVMIYQDLDRNGKLNTNFMGIPSEPYGASGEPSFGPPSWAKAKVRADGRSISVTLN